MTAQGNIGFWIQTFNPGASNSGLQARSRCRYRGSRCQQKCLSADSREALIPFAMHRPQHRLDQIANAAGVYSLRRQARINFCWQRSKPTHFRAAKVIRSGMILFPFPPPAVAVRSLFLI